MRSPGWKSKFDNCMKNLYPYILKQECCFEGGDVLVKFICTAVLAAVCLTAVPQQACAMDLDVRFSLNDAQWTTEIWYDHGLLWQVAVCCDGVVPVSAGNNAKYRTLIVPEFENGFFLLNIK